MTQTTTLERLTHLFECETATVSDVSYIDALRQRWDERAIVLDLLPLAGIVNVNEFPRTFSIHPLESWTVERVSMREVQRFAIPRGAQVKLNTAYAMGMPLKWLLWAEQHVTAPEIEYRQETVYVAGPLNTRPRVHLDPALIALIKAGDGVGIPYLVHCWLHPEAK